MDDIWGSYYTQEIIGVDKLIYNKASVYQDRNVQDLITNLEKEIIGYRHTLNFTQKPYTDNSHIPEQTQKFLDIYFNSFK
jgi:flagellar biosynthesis chaperone FliJ